MKRRLSANIESTLSGIYERKTIWSHRKLAARGNALRHARRAGMRWRIEAG
ncbi:hypothetical protein [Noviherbaspirillum aerium]|uniref:hypothetical protein n=1 Tax=Noviherbaspirillum aerium TaxID=2588497 RepID=UPI00178C3BCE|nr:hypothetical protein [Noviherbaspirillum aerium]